ncbi:MAG TPA: glycosyltransferase [Planctomycetaceae bacterium]|nr:glycosyltransferase [Planctomycetaceae bacterium]
MNQKRVMQPLSWPEAFSSRVRPDTVGKVLMAGGLRSLDAPGGGQVQMYSLLEALRALGVKVRLWRPWEDRLSDVGVIHLFGSHAEHLGLVEAARRQGVPVVLSPIAWFDPLSYWAEPRGLARRVAGCVGLMLRAVVPGVPSWRRRLYHGVDRLLPNSQAEAEQLMRYFHVPPARIQVVPNGADPRFAEGDPEPFARLVGRRGFVLVPGRIEPRKNQLRLIEAIRRWDFPTVVLGDPVPGHEVYYQRCRRAAGREVQFIGRLDHKDPLLASAYAACGCVALASYYETPGLVALEAGMSGTPLVLPSAGAAPEYFGHFALYVFAWDRRGIERAVQTALARGRSPELAEHVRAHFSWEAAAAATLEAYAAVRDDL